MVYTEVEGSSKDGNELKMFLWKQMLALELFRQLITLSALWASLKRKETPAASKLGLG